MMHGTGCSIRYIEWEIQETPQRACLRLRQQMELDVEAHLGRMIQTNPALRWWDSVVFCCFFDHHTKQVMRSD